MRRAVGSVALALDAAIRVADLAFTLPDDHHPPERVGRDSGLSLGVGREGIDLELTPVRRRLAEAGGRRLNGEGHSCRKVNK